MSRVEADSQQKRPLATTGLCQRLCGYASEDAVGKTLETRMCARNTESMQPRSFCYIKAAEDIEVVQRCRSQQQCRLGGQDWTDMHKPLCHDFETSQAQEAIVA